MGKVGVADGRLAPRADQSQTVPLLAQSNGVGEQVVHHQWVVKVHRVVCSLRQGEGRNATVLLYLQLRLRQMEPETSQSKYSMSAPMYSVYIHVAKVKLTPSRE